LKEKRWWLFLLNNCIWISSSIFEIVGRKSNDKKFQTEPDRSINGTLHIDVFANPKREWTFNFHVDDRQLLRLYNMWKLATSFTLIDSDEESYTAACTSSDFSPNQETKESINSNNWTIQLDFKEI
jgi:hypothetical protein